MSALKSRSQGSIASLLATLTQAVPPPERRKLFLTSKVARDLLHPNPIYLLLLYSRHTPSPIRGTIHFNLLLHTLSYVKTFTPPGKRAHTPHPILTVSSPAPLSSMPHPSH